MCGGRGEGGVYMGLGEEVKRGYRGGFGYRYLILHV